MATAYLYGRVSTRKQIDKMTREDQERACREYYEDKLEPLGLEFGGFTFDEAESGGKAFSERKHGRNLYHSLQRGDCIVCYEYERLVRDTDDWVPTRKDLKTRGVAIHFVHDAFASVTSPSTKKFGVDVMVAAATLMREQLSEKQIERNREKRGAGIPVGHVAAPGWKIVGEGARRAYRVDHNERAMIDYMQELRDEGMSCATIAFHMRRQSVKDKWNPKRWRGMTDERHVRWALRARANGYPQDITSLKDFERAWRQGRFKGGRLVSA